ncbi:MAG: hypothetical protein C0631_01485 [Sedimenticola sp.]|nr:MAG: hypothetical protein C0631_01485 [Sedimenticola sp.]
MREIGRFKVMKKLGAGAQGTVYLCLDPELQRKVAIKLLDRSLFGGGREEMDFLREARAISRIQHPNIVSIFDAGRTGSQPYLVFEYVDGELLSDRFAKSAPAITKTLDICAGILNGVAQVHREGIVHRDLKPSNIILNGNSMPKIMDFGLARVLTKNAQADTIRAGTPRYMAPEYIAEGVVSSQTDVFSLGAILFELLSGQYAFDAKNQQALLKSIQLDAVVPPSTHNVDVKPRLDAIVMKALEKDPASRYESADEMYQALLDYRLASDRQSGDPTVRKGTVEFLIRRMQHKSDFPALSESIRTLNQLAASEDQDMSHLASILIRDFALTNKILRVVNSAYYSRFAGKIGTISRAIVVLGINTIRTIAASLIFFEHLHNKTQAGRLKDLIASAVFSATLARQAAEDAGMQHSEEGFLCGMLHNLGNVLVAYYLHSESEEIDRLVRQEGVDPEQAQRRVLGMTFQQMGMAIAKQWNFPETIIQGMMKVDPVKPGDLKNEDVKLRLIANFSNEAATVIGETDEDDRPVKALLRRFRMSLAISEKRFSRMVEEARNEFSQLSSLESRHKSPFMRRLTSQPILQHTVKKPRDPVQDLTQTLALEVFQEAVFDAGGNQEQQSQVPETILTEGLQEVSAMLLDDQVNLNQVFNVVLETIYRAMSFSRVVLCLQDVTRKNYSARLGFGREIEHFIESFHFPRSYSPDVFHAALKNGVDVYIANTQDHRISSDIPAWYKTLSTAGSFAVFPLVIKQSPIGLIYADHVSPKGITFEGKSVNLIKALRNQLVLGFRSRL